MKYKVLGQTGLLVSELSFRTWITGKNDETSHEDRLYEVMSTAFKAGVNYFDCAEVYGDGKIEEDTGKAYERGMKEKLWKRSDLIIATKLFFGAMPSSESLDYNEYQRRENRIGLSRKHIVEGMRESLERLNIDYVDIVYAHRFDPLVKMEEIIRSFNYLIDEGYTFYWGTSEWTAQQIQEAKTVAERLGLIGPTIEQAQYNLLTRKRVEVDFNRLYPDMGIAAWSPLALGILTGKYSGGIPEGSRLGKSVFEKTRRGEILKEGVNNTEELRPIAEKLGCTLAQLALAWCMSNPNVTTCIGGASSIEQVKENLKAIEIIDKLTPSILETIDDVFYKPTTSEGDRMALGVRTRARNIRHLRI